MPSPEGDHIMDSAFIHQAANELVQNAGTRNIKQIARSCSLDISETSRIKDMLGLLSLYFDKPLMVLIKFLPFKPNTHAMRTMKYFSSVWLTASSPSSFVCPYTFSGL